MGNSRANSLNFSVGHTKEHEEIYILSCSTRDKNLTLVLCPHTIKEASRQSVRSHVDLRYGIVHIQVAMLGFIMAPNQITRIVMLAIQTCQRAALKSFFFFKLRIESF